MIGRKILKRIIIILRGCLVRLERWDSPNTGCVSSDAPQQQPPVVRNQEMVSGDSINISAFDGYMDAYGINRGLNFVRLLQRIGYLTENSYLSEIERNISDASTVIALFEDAFLQRELIPPSPLRQDEHQYVSRYIVEKELATVGLQYDETKSLYDNCQELIFANQCQIISNVQSQFQSILSKLRAAQDAEAQKKLLDILNTEIAQRKSILEIRLK